MWKGPFPGAARGAGPSPEIEMAACMEQVEVVGNLSGEAVLVHGPDHRILYANSASAAGLGASTREDLIGLGMVDLLDPAERPRVEERLEAAREGRPLPDEEFNIVGLDRVKRTMLVSSAPVTYAGQPARLVVARDVTAHKEAERRRDNLEEQLAAAQRLESLGRLAGGVAHDFNNLLTVIQGYTEMALADAHRGSALEQSLLRVDEAAERAATLTRQLLAFGRRQVLRPSVLDLNEVVTSMQSMLARLIGEDVTIAVTLSPAPCLVKADPGQVEQVIMNLVMNARDAMPDGGEVVIATRRERQAPPFVYGGPRNAGCHAVLSVSDNGRGMDEETVARIFEPFFSTKPLGRGTGLGLSTVYGIVKQSEGGIEVESQPGAGTTFRVWLPVAERDEERQHGAGEDERAVSSPRHHGRRVLLVEDDETIRELAAKVLGSAGFFVDIVADAESALGLIERQDMRYDILVTDVILPGMDGAALAETVRWTHPSLRVLFISGYTAKRIGAKGIIGDEVDFLEKPFSPRALVRKVREVLDKD